MASRTVKKKKRTAKGQKPLRPKKRATKAVKPKTRTRVRPAKKSTAQSRTKSPLRKKSPHAASHKSPRKKPERKPKRRAPRRPSASVADRFAQGAARRYVAETLALGRDSEQGDRYKVYSDAETLARRALAADLYRREQTGETLTDAEHEWFDGYAVPSGRVAKHYSRLRWIDHGLGGSVRRKLVHAYEEGGDEALADYASRAAHELRVPLREVYTLFWSG